MTKTKHFWTVANCKIISLSDCNVILRARCLKHVVQREEKQDHLRMNVALDLIGHLRSIDLFRSMIIKKNRSKVRDSHWIVIG